MKNLEAFESFENDDLKTSVKSYIKDNYDEFYVDQQIEESMYNYIDDEWEDAGYESEYEWYQDYGRGEAEADVRMEIESDVLKHFQISYEEYENTTGQELWDTIYEIFPQLEV